MVSLVKVKCSKPFCDLEIHKKSKKREAFFNHNMQFGAKDNALWNMWNCMWIFIWNMNGWLESLFQKGAFPFSGWSLDVYKKWNSSLLETTGHPIVL